MLLYYMYNLRNKQVGTIVYETVIKENPSKKNKNL